jgi:hypothetical protein
MLIALHLWIVMPITIMIRQGATFQLAYDVELGHREGLAYSLHKVLFGRDIFTAREALKPP